MKNNMVGFFVLLTVAAAWAVAGCQVAEHDKGNGDGAETGVQYLDIVMAAQQEGDDTRTGVTNGGTAVSWTSGDAIAVFCDGRSSRLVNSSSSVSDFTGIQTKLISIIQRQCLCHFREREQSDHDCASCGADRESGIL